MAKFWAQLIFMKCGKPMYINPIVNQIAIDINGYKWWAKFGEIHHPQMVVFYGGLPHKNIHDPHSFLVPALSKLSMASPTELRVVFTEDVESSQQKRRLCLEKKDWGF